jgi:uncharacterized coiled-coil protein SlyX
MIYTKSISQAIQVAHQGITIEHLKYNLQILKEHCKFQDKLGTMPKKMKNVKQPLSFFVI